jgi:hypothetical protein
LTLQFLIDNNLPPALARALNNLSARDGARVYALRDRFPENADDLVWMQALRDDGDRWCIVSTDQFRKRARTEREFIRSAGFTVFVLHSGWSSHSYWPKASQLVAWWPKIIEQAHLAQRSMFSVPWRVTGRFEQIHL